jgi:small subunit ribosomal protein S16
MGAKKKPFYRLVVADARSPRDGRFIEQLGIYDPLTSPATIRIDGPKVQEWLAKGAQPSDAARSLLQREGIIQGAATRHPKAVNVGAVKKEPTPVARRVEAPRAAAAAEAPADEVPAEAVAEAAEETPVEAAAAEAPVEAVAEEEPVEAVAEEAPAKAAAEEEPAGAAAEEEKA